MPPTLKDLEADDYTDIAFRCEPCRRTVLYPFKMLAPHMMDWTLEEVGVKAVCEKCGAKPDPSSIKPWRQSDAHGYAKLRPR